MTLDATESLEFLSDVQPISKVKGKEHLMSSSATLSAPIAPPALDELCINTLRFLAVDMVQEANSGHPGLPMGSASMAFALWPPVPLTSPLATTSARSGAKPRPTSSAPPRQRTKSQGAPGARQDEAIVLPCPNPD